MTKSKDSMVAGSIISMLTNTSTVLVIASTFQLLPDVGNLSKIDLQKCSFLFDRFFRKPSFKKCLVYI